MVVVEPSVQGTSKLQFKHTERDVADLAAGGLKNALQTNKQKKNYER